MAERASFFGEILAAECRLDDIDDDFKTVVEPRHVHENTIIIIVTFEKRQFRWSSTVFLNWSVLWCDWLKNVIVVYFTSTFSYETSVLVDNNSAVACANVKGVYVAVGQHAHGSFIFSIFILHPVLCFSWTIIAD